MDEVSKCNVIVNHDGQVSFRKGNTVNYVLKGITFSQAVKLLIFIKQSFNKGIGVCDYEVMCNHIQKYLNDKSINLNIVNVENKYYNEELDMFLRDNYLNLWILNR